MNKKDFLLCGNERIKKSAIIDYWPDKNSDHICFWVAERGEHVYDGTMEQFEALLFDDDDSVAPDSGRLSRR